jgi:two-component system, OmpR family, response regulator
MLGWRLVDEEGDLSHGAGTVPFLAQPAGWLPEAWLRLHHGVPRALVLLSGIASSAERAAWLRLGFGDVVGSVSLGELEARALRLSALLPRELAAGPLRLDLFARDAFAGTRPLGLHPREFALLWRLTEARSAAVAAEDLLREVWRLSFRPETNRLAVHVSRLRAKLRDAGCPGLVETVPGGGYRLAPEPRQEFPLDAYLRLREDGTELQQDLGHAA